MPAGHQKTIVEVTPALLAYDQGWRGQTAETRFTTADAGSVDPIGPAGWQARAVKITAQPAQACSVLVDGGYVCSLIEAPLLITSMVAADMTLRPYSPWVWVPMGTVSFNAGQLVSQTIVVAPYRWVRVRLINGNTAQGAVTISEEYTDL